MQSDPEALHRRYRSTLEPKDLEPLVLHYRGLAHSLARRYRRAGLPHDDLEQVACVGLVKALQRFDPDRGYAFTTYAVPTILGELRHFCRHALWPVHVPRAVQERVVAVRRASGDLIAGSGRAPTVRELAEKLDCRQEDVVDALLAEGSHVVRSLEPGTTDEDVQALPYAAPLAVDESGYAAVEDRDELQSALRGLTDDERELVRLRFGEELSHREIGQRLGMSPSQVGRLLTTTIARLSCETGSPPARRIPRRGARRDHGRPRIVDGVHA